MTDASPPEHHDEKGSNWRRPAVWAAIGVVVTIVLAAGVVIALLQQPDGAKAVSDNAPLIAAVLALGGVGTAQMVSIALEDQRTRETRALEDQRIHETRDLEAQRAHEAALQNYFERVGELLIEKPLHRASPGDNLSTVVRAQTLSVLEGLDPERKRTLLMFLYESGLISKRKPVVSLVAAKLTEANLSGADLSGADLSGADLSWADLSWADLSWATLYKANLYKANLGRANLSGANLSGADLSWANLYEATLSRVNLYETDLSRANLKVANLNEAAGITTEELEQQAYSLEGATMPNGSKHP